MVRGDDTSEAARLAYLGRNILEETRALSGPIRPTTDETGLSATCTLRGHSHIFPAQSVFFRLNDPLVGRTCADKSVTD